MSDELGFEDGWTVDATPRGEDAYLVRRFSLAAEDASGLRFESSTDRCSIGSDPSNDLVIDDPTVSRFHCEVWIGPEGPRVRDLGSRNGTRVDGVRVAGAWLKDGSRLRVGRTHLRFAVGDQQNRLPLSDRRELGTMVGASVGMRAVFAQIERVAPADVTVLLSGETGTGKEEAASTIHALSRRADGPFVVVDCGAIPANLIESHLFGHERGAFTGATARRIGAFEQADQGTVFLDEIAELPIEMQPKLLRVLEQQEVRRVGATDTIPISVRVIAATHRDLREAVGAGRFREDLYYRLAVVRLALPPLRERPDDIPLLVERFLSDMQLDPAAEVRLRDPVFLAHLRKAAWPGNVRELRNYLQRSAILEEVGPLPPRVESSLQDLVDPTLPYAEARRRLTAHFERAYAERIVAHHRGNVSAAARAAGIGRSYLHRLLKRDPGDSV